MNFAKRLMPLFMIYGISFGGTWVVAGDKYWNSPSRNVTAAQVRIERIVSPEQVSVCIRMLVEGGWNVVWTVLLTDAKSQPHKQINVYEKRALDLHDFVGAQITTRQ